MVRLVLGVSALPLIAAIAAQALGNLLFHAAVGRWLSASDYGGLGAVLAAMTMLAVPLSALQAAASAHAAGSVPARDTAWRVLLGVGGATLVPAALIVAVAGWIQGYFHLASPADALQLAPYLVVSALLATARGLLLGHRLVGTVAMSYLLGTAARLVVGLALTSSFGVTGALAGTLAGEGVSLLVAATPLLVAGQRAGGAGALRLTSVIRATAAVTGLFLLSTVDLLLARHHLQCAESGAYVAAATVAKTVLALPSAIVSVVFPRLVTAWEGRQGGRALAVGAVAVLAPAFAGAAVVAVAPGLVLQVLYGDGFATATSLVRILAIIAALTGGVTLLTHAALARRSAVIAVPWIGALLEILLIEARHGSALDIAAGSATALAVALVLIAILEPRAWRHGPALPALPAPTAQFAPDHADLVKETAATGMAPHR